LVKVVMGQRGVCLRVARGDERNGGSRGRVPTAYEERPTAQTNALVCQVHSVATDDMSSTTLTAAAGGGRAAVASRAISYPGLSERALRCRNHGCTGAKAVARPTRTRSPPGRRETAVSFGGGSSDPSVRRSAGFRADLGVVQRQRAMTFNQGKATGERRTRQVGALLARPFTAMT